MTETSDNKLPVWFWIISVLALIWNFMGVGAFIMQLTMSDETRMKLPELERAMYAAIPTWYMIAFGIAVFAGFLGCVGLVLRKAWAVKLFILSFIAVLVQQLYMF